MNKWKMLEYFLILAFLALAVYAAWWDLTHCYNIGEQVPWQCRFIG